MRGTINQGSEVRPKCSISETTTQSPAQQGDHFDLTRDCHGRQIPGHNPKGEWVDMHYTKSMPNWLRKELCDGKSSQLFVCSEPAGSIL